MSTPAGAAILAAARMPATKLDVFPVRVVMGHLEMNLRDLPWSIARSATAGDLLPAGMAPPPRSAFGIWYTSAQRQQLPGPAWDRPQPEASAAIEQQMRVRELFAPTSP